MEIEGQSSLDDLNPLRRVILPGLCQLPFQAVCHIMQGCQLPVDRTRPLPEQLRCVGPLLQEVAEPVALALGVGNAAANLL